MNENFDDLKDKLNELATWIEQASHAAEQRMNGVNEMIGRLHATGYAQEMVMVGEAIHRRQYAPPDDYFRSMGQSMRDQARYAEFSDQLFAEPRRRLPDDQGGALEEFRHGSAGLKVLRGDVGERRINEFWTFSLTRCGLP